MFPLPYFLLVVALLLPLSLLPAKTYIWTDTNGQQIEAEFVRCSADTLTIFMQGQELDLPINSLSAFSKALAIKLREEAANGGSQIPTWTDTQGRKIQAKFVSADASSITLDMDGNIFKLPLDMLDAQSMRQAFSFIQSGASSAPSSTPSVSPPAPKPAAATTPETKPPAASPAAASPPNPPAPAKPEGTDPDGPLDLSSEQVWISADGRALKAKFIRLNGEEVLLLMPNKKEVDLPLDQLSEKSQKLAQKLEDLNEERNQKLQAFTTKRLAMKVPTVSVEDLKRTHKLINTEGATIEAQFLSANNLDVSLQLSGKSSSLDLPWDKFSEESLALLEGLRRLQQKLIPKTIAAKGNQLEKFSNGPFAGYNTVQQTEFFDAALSASGTYVSIWLKPKDSSFPTRRFTVAFGTTYVVTYERKNSDGTVRKLPNGKPDIRRSTRSRKIVSFESAPNASMDGGNLTLKGTFDNQGTFQYNVSFLPDSILMWSKMKEPTPPKDVSSTSIYLRASIPSIVSNSINKTQKEVDEIVGDGYLLETPYSGNARKFPFREKWLTMNNKYKGQKFSGGLKQMRIAGFPFEQNIMNISPLNSKGSGLRREGSYTKVAPYQGFSYLYSSTAKEIAKGQALRIAFARN